MKTDREIILIVIIVLMFAGIAFYVTQNA